MNGYVLTSKGWVIVPGATGGDFKTGSDIVRLYAGSSDNVQALVYLSPDQVIVFSESDRPPPVATRNPIAL